MPATWDEFTRKLSDAADTNGRPLDDEELRRRLGEIADAIGRPVTKVILDRRDNVVLELGDLITHEAVRRACEAGQLESMLRSGYRGEVTFARDEMRARAAPPDGRRHDRGNPVHHEVEGPGETGAASAAGPTAEPSPATEASVPTDTPVQPDESSAELARVEQLRGGADLQRHRWTSADLAGVDAGEKPVRSGAARRRRHRRRLARRARRLLPPEPPRRPVV